MIDKKEAFNAVKEKLESMTREEREEYLKKMGFEFDEK